MEERASRGEAALNVIESSACKRGDQRFQSRHVFERADVDMHMKRAGKFKCDHCVGGADAVQNIRELGKFVATLDFETTGIGLTSAETLICFLTFTACLPGLWPTLWCNWHHPLFLRIAID